MTQGSRCHSPAESGSLARRPPGRRQRAAHARVTGSLGSLAALAGWVQVQVAAKSQGDSDSRPRPIRSDSEVTFQASIQVHLGHGFQRDSLSCIIVTVFKFANEDS